MRSSMKLNKPCEGIDYKLVPVDDADNDQAWDVLFLEGPFPETTIRYGAIKFDGERDCLTFNFFVVQSPDPTLSSEYTELQEYAADVLEDILDNAVAKGQLVTGDASGNQAGTTNSEEPSYE